MRRNEAFAFFGRERRCTVRFLVKLVHVHPKAARDGEVIRRQAVLRLPRAILSVTP